MNRSKFGLCLVVAAMIAGFVALQLEVKRIATRLNQLEARSSLAAQPGNPIAIRRKGTLPAPALPLEQEQHGEIWGQGVVNGWTYYLVPCGQGN